MTQLFSFLGFELDADGRLQTEKGHVVSVRPKTLAVLEYLVQNRGRTVSKDEILGAVWPGKVVEEQAVFQSISEIRALFGGSVSVRTVRGRGYRWVAETYEKKPIGGRRRYALWATAAAILIGIAAFAHLKPSPHLPEIIVRDISQSHGGQTGGVVQRSGMESLLVEHLRRLGWRSHSFASNAVGDDSFLLDTEFFPAESGMEVHYTLSIDNEAVTGTLRSPSSLGAIRDLANDIEPFIMRASTNALSRLSLDGLFRTAKAKIDDGNYALAASYLRVIIAEQPDFNEPRLALTYTLLQDGRPAEALPVILKAHAQAEAAPSLQEQMNSEILLSQVYLRLGEHQQATHAAASALDLGTQSNDLLVVAEAQELLGELAIANGRLDSGLQQLDVALELYRAFCPTGERRVAQRLTSLRMDGVAAGGSAVL